jgi:hypothetical protein
MPPPDPAVTMPPPEPVEPVVDPAAEATPTAPVVDEAVVDETVEAPPPPAEPAGPLSDWDELPDRDGDGISNDFEDAFNPSTEEFVSEEEFIADGVVAEDAGDVMVAEDYFPISDVAEPVVAEDDSSILPDDWDEAPLDISDRINLDSAAVDDLSARQFLEVEELLKDASNLSDPAALEGLDPSQMQLVIQALAGHVNDPSGDSEGGGFGVQDLLDPDAPGPTLDPGLIDNLDADQMGQVQEVLGGEGPPDLAALEDLSPDQVQAVVQSFLGYLGTPGANVVAEPEVAETLEPDQAISFLEDAIAGGDEAEISEAIEDLRESVGEPMDLDNAEGPIGTSQSALTLNHEELPDPHETDMSPEDGDSGDEFLADGLFGAISTGEAIYDTAGTDPGEGSYEVIETIFDVNHLVDNPEDAALVIGDRVIDETEEAIVDTVFGGNVVTGIFGGPILGGFEAVTGVDIVEDVIEEIPIVGDVVDVGGDVIEDVGDAIGDFFDF